MLWCDELCVSHTQRGRTGRLYSIGQEFLQYWVLTVDYGTGRNSLSVRRVVVTVGHGEFLPVGSEQEGEKRGRAA